MTKQELPTVYFNGEVCTLRYSKYYMGKRVCIELVTLQGEPMCTCTLNAPYVPLCFDEVLIKDYSENGGVLYALVFAGVVEYIADEPLEHSLMVAKKCRLLVKPE